MYHHNQSENIPPGEQLANQYLQNIPNTIHPSQPIFYPSTSNLYNPIIENSNNQSVQNMNLQRVQQNYKIINAVNNTSRLPPTGSMPVRPSIGVNSQQLQDTLVQVMTQQNNKQQSQQNHPLPVKKSKPSAAKRKLPKEQQAALPATSNQTNNSLPHISTNKLFTIGPPNSKDRYSILNEIGNGAYGTVFLGLDNHADKDTILEYQKLYGQNTKKLCIDNGIIKPYVAIKRLRVPQSDEGMPLSHVREIALLRQLEHFKHPNVIRLLDVCTGKSTSVPDEIRLNLIFEHVVCVENLDRGSFL